MPVHFRILNASIASLANVIESARRVGIILRTLRLECLIVHNLNDSGYVRVMRNQCALNHNV